MKAWAVIGANYGDEGKGLITDYLCDKHDADLVVRFNGGAQAGHTVVTPDGRRHVFHHFGSGTFAGVATYLSRFFVCNPILFAQEYEQLSGLGLSPEIYADRICLVTTPWDMVINQAIENKRGPRRHGSCGVGFNETLERSMNEDFILRVCDLTHHDTRNKTLHRIRHEWIPHRLQQLELEPADIDRLLPDWDAAYAAFCLSAGLFCGRVLLPPAPTPSNKPERIVFEGAQGLLLDQGNFRSFPHVTRSNTGLANASRLCAEWEIDEIEVVYVTRTYLTRHGAGPLPNETTGTNLLDATNVDHPFQGSLRYAPLDPVDVVGNTSADFVLNSADNAEYRLAITHCDQRPPNQLLIGHADLLSYGPTRMDVKEND